MRWVQWLQWYWVVRYLTFKDLVIIACGSLAFGIVASFILPSTGTRPDAPRWFGAQPGYEASAPKPVEQVQPVITEEPHTKADSFVMTPEEYAEFHNKLEQGN